MFRFNIHRATVVRAQAAMALLALAAAHPARADGEKWRAATPLKTYTQECGACHTAYPANLLPAASWKRVMAGLGHHFGTDASLDATASAPIAVWLQANAGTDKRLREGPPQDRITLSAWFERKHRQVEPVVWTLPSVKTAVNCPACHSGADMGIYSERGLRVPAGMDPRQARAWRD